MVGRARAWGIAALACVAVALAGGSSPARATTHVEKPTTRVVHVSLDGSEIETPTIVLRTELDGPAILVTNSSLPRTARRVLRTSLGGVGALDGDAPEPLSRFFRAELDDPATFALFAAPGPGSARPIRSEL